MLNCDDTPLFTSVHSSFAILRKVCDGMWASGTNVYILFCLPSSDPDASSVLPVPSFSLQLGISACPVPLRTGPLILVSSEHLETKSILQSELDGRNISDASSLSKQLSQTS
jgi:hypothetical protein